MGKKVPFLLLSLLWAGLASDAQVRYAGKVEGGYLNFRNNTVAIESGPNWQGYYLHQQNGFDLNVVNGIDTRSQFFAGLGIGYLQFERYSGPPNFLEPPAQSALWRFRGYHGYSFYADFEYLPAQQGLMPMFGAKFGFSDLWNQYEGGTRTGLLEIALGLNYKYLKTKAWYVKSGLLIMQQAFIIPFRLGYRW